MRCISVISFLILGFLSVFSELVPKEQGVANLINEIRSDYQLSKVVYEPFLERELLVYKAVYGSDAVFNNASTVLDFATFDGYRNYFFLFKGAFKQSLTNNLKYRINQWRCFDFNKCDCALFNDYTSCLKAKPDYSNGNTCSFAWKYLPNLLVKSLTKVACVDLDDKYACFGQYQTGKPAADCIF